MQQIAPDARLAAQRRTLRLARVTLAGFCLLFVLLLVWAGVSIYGFYLGATDPEQATLVVRGSLERLGWQPAGRSLYQGVADGQGVGEGDALRAVSNAGYGQVASIRIFDQSQIDLWAGAELRLSRMRTSRWNQRLQEVEVVQSGGYVRYDLEAGQPYEEVRFQVRVGEATLELAPGGSYSVELRASERVINRADRVELPAQIVDLAVRSGVAVVVGANGKRVELGARQRVEIDPAGIPGLGVPARWELIRDGSFSLYSEPEYNNTTLDDPDLTRPASRHWKVEATPTLPPEQRGFFRLSQVCRPPAISRCGPNERRIAAWFYRAGQQTNGFAVFITQRLGPDGAGVDISEYRSLTFALWARVLEQSIRDAGDRGSECPLMVRIVGRRESPTDPDQQRVICLYVDDGDGQLRAKDDEITYRPVQLAEWHELKIDLRAAEWLPNFRYLSLIQIYANGHDYDARVAEVSLIGEQ